MSGGRGRDMLEAALPGYSLDLRPAGHRARRPRGGQAGDVSLGALGQSKYYSWTSLRTTGTMVDHGVHIKVTGLSWMDHQWGPLDLPSGGGWDWFSVQLSNGQQYMLYFIRNQATISSRASAPSVSSAGRAAHLGSVGEKATGSWHSPVTGITYGSGWQLTLPGGHLDVTPDLRRPGARPA